MTAFKKRIGNDFFRQIILRERNSRREIQGLKIKEREIKVEIDTEHWERNLLRKFDDVKRRGDKIGRG